MRSPLLKVFDCPAIREARTHGDSVADPTTRMQCERVFATWHTLKTGDCCLSARNEIADDGLMLASEPRPLMSTRGTCGSDNH